MKKLTILLLILFCFSECKYEKGPLITFTTKENRVIGVWGIDEYFINGEDKLSSLDTLEIEHYSFFVSDFGQSSGAYFNFVQMRSGRSDMNIPEYTSWGFSENKENLKLTQSNYVDSNWQYIDSTRQLVSTGWQPRGIPLFVDLIEEQWTIVKLSNKKMWLRINRNNNKYEIHLYKI